MDATEWNPKFPNKFDRASLASKLFFDWVRKPLWDSYKGRKLKVYLEDVPKELKAGKLREFMTKKENTKIKPSNNLLITFNRLFVFEYVATSILSFIRYCVVPLIQAYFMGLLVGSLRATDSDPMLWFNRYVSSGVIIVASLITVLLYSQMMFLGDRTGLKLRVIASSLVYEKVK
ncbi:hypothetical protein CHUAL_004663 [Chamberlinius hualienensis]